MKIEKSIKSKVTQKTMKLSRCYRYFLFFIMITIDSSLDISNGIFSSASKEIKNKLKINNTKFGTFSTATSMGKIISSFLFILINQKISRKWLISTYVFLNGMFLFCFKITENVRILIVIYGLLGLTKTAPGIYIPVWINQFGHSEYKTVEITTVLLFQSIGKIIGHLINLIFGRKNWQNGFLISGVILIILSFCCAISNEDYFSRNLFPKEIQNIDSENKKRISCTIFEETNEDKFFDNKEIDYGAEFAMLFKNPLYIISLICGSIVRGLITCLNYWFPDFLRHLIPKQHLKVTISFIFISLIGPFGGIIFNGYLKRYIGSYESRKASWPIVILQFIASIFAISIGLMNSLISVCISTICYLIFNSSVLALIQGIIISSVDKNLSATGFAFANVCMQILTGPLPIVYGLINDKYKMTYPWIAMCSIMSINLLAIPLLICLAIFRNKKFDEEEKLKRKDNEEELIER
jgi:sugar phosphate permease